MRYNPVREELIPGLPFRQGFRVYPPHDGKYTIYSEDIQNPPTVVWQDMSIVVDDPDIWQVVHDLSLYHWHNEFGLLHQVEQLRPDVLEQLASYTQVYFAVHVYDPNIEPSDDEEPPFLNDGYMGWTILYYDAGTMLP